MELELEAVFIEVDKNALREKLVENNATLVQSETLMKRIIFDTGENSYIRVRDEGKQITVTYKNVIDASRINGTKEINLTVDNFNHAVEFIKALGFKPKADQETMRESWTLGNVEIDIDTWPWLPTYVEIEGPTVEDVKNVSALLGFDYQNAHFGCVDEIYKLYYNVTNDDINYCPEIKFVPVPDWLKQKQKYEFKLPNIGQQKE